MRETRRTQQQLIPTYRGPYFTVAAAQTWPPTSFSFPVLAAGFRILKNKFPQNLLRYDISLIDQKT